MRHLRFTIIHAVAFLLAVASSLFSPRIGSGAEFELYQHGGRATGQDGAFTARASDPSAVTYNPAAITKLQGTQIEAGLDFANPRDDYRSATGRFSAHHVISFPPAAYLTHPGSSVPPPRPGRPRRSPRRSSSPAPPGTPATPSPVPMRRPSGAPPPE